MTDTMPRQTNYGKGDFPRKVDYHKYDYNWLRIFGVPCPICKRKGFHVDKGRTGKEIKTSCIFCNGIGYVEKERVRQ